MPITKTIASTASHSDVYTPKSGVPWDEYLDGSGNVRTHFAGLARDLHDLPPGELKRRADTARRIVDEQGITYNVYGDPRGMERPWQLDPIPFLIAPAEWASLETAITQRAELLDHILADCYGPQDLIRSAWLPPALVFAQSDFLRPAHGIRPAGGRHLNFYAADLARSPDGQWWVLGDRTAIPTGAGYALANRLITSRVLPEPFRGCRVQRQAGFFRELQNSLSALAPHPVGDPRVVLLTPGPFNETYFEQSWLARYLGYTMVQGEDLTVRDDRVFLKTLSGLEPVDVILRRVDDDFCDPLELRNDSMLGVPGLVGAVRAGNVALANALGTGLLQSPAFMAFLPGLCQHLLGEELRMPSVATWWCGQKSAEKYALENLAELNVRPAFRTRSEPALSPDEMRARIRFQPHLWTAQERVALSTAPSWNGSALVPQPIVLRVYVVATPNGYRVMPGGLTRVAPDGDVRLISMQHGGASKDTWVLSDAPVEEVTLLQSPSRAIELRRVGNNLPSRLADNFFWLGRYAERADATARLLRSTLLRFNPESAGSAMPLLTPLLRSMELQGQLLPEWPTHNAEALEADLMGAIFDPTRACSLRNLADRLEHLAMLVRDRTSNDVWRVLSQLDECLTLPGEGRMLLAGEAIAVLNRLLMLSASLSGFSRENMTRAQGWRFLDMGLRIERSLYLCNFLDCALRSPGADNPSLLEAVLEFTDCTLTYRSRYNLLPDITAVFDLILLDDTNPRSLLFQLLQLVKHFERLPREKQSALPSLGHRLLIECVTRVRLLDPRELTGLIGGWHAGQTGTVLRDLLRDLPLLSDAIAASYFTHSSISRAD